MIRKRGFTLVELLVVIAIIALLMSILMPALSRVKKQAKDVVGLSNLNQWGKIISMYTNDYHGYFWEGYGGGIGDSNWWIDSLRSYYKDAKIRYCPMATKPYDDGSMPPFGAWTGGGYLTDDEGGSYGINGWLEDQPNTEYEWGLNPKKRWRHCNVQGSDDIPALFDNLWIDGWPEHYDVPPDTREFIRLSYEGDYMQRFVMDRHEGRAGGLFMDGNARLVGLKELWVLKWNRLFDQSYPLPDWPEWMKKLQEPER